MYNTPLSNCVCTSCDQPRANFIPSLSSHTVNPSLSAAVTNEVHPNSDFFNMPAVQDWKTTPLSIISKIFDENKESSVNTSTKWEEIVVNFFEEKLSTEEAWKSIPSMNATPNHDLVDGQLVRFRCMIQDMFDPEFYLNKYEVRDLSSGAVRMETGRYRDGGPNGAREEILFDSPKSENCDRQSFYVISVPCENPWVVEGFRQDAPQISTPSCSHHNRLKRGHEEENGQEGTVEMEVEEPLSAPVKENGESPNNNKKAKTENGERATGNAVNGQCNVLNLPVSNPKAKAAILKLYDVDDGVFKVNDIVEFIGILSLDPNLAHCPNSVDDHDLFSHFNQQENMAHSPPPSLVPRLHVVKYKKLVHNNPLLPMELPVQMSAEELTAFEAEAKIMREELHSILTSALLGDGITANYLICHLMSQIYLRRDILSLGKLSLNIHSVPMQQNYSKRLATILQLLLCKSHYLPMTVDTLNTTAFVPKKDYQANRLVSGLLQLSKNTHLILDETVMADGQLNPDGVRNLTAIGHLITWQKVEYNFNYHQIEFESDVPCLILSEGRSMLPSDSQVMLHTTDVASPTVISEKFSAIGQRLTVPLLNRLRKYITCVRNLNYELTEEVQKAVQDDFVSMRQGGDRSMTQEDFHHLLVLARLMALSNGKRSLTPEIWEQTKTMEAERKRRAAALPPRPNNTSRMM